MIPGNALPLLLGASAAGADYRVARGLRFEAADGAFLSRTPASAGNRKTWTWSGWVKNACDAGLSRPVTMLFAQDGVNTGLGNYFGVGLINSPIAFQLNVTDGATVYLQSNNVFTDPSAWYHFVCTYDSTQAVANDRLRLYVNGREIASFVTNNRSAITLDSDGAINNTIPHTIGRFGTAEYSSCYFADIHFVAGQALTPASFGETDATTGQWLPKTYAEPIGAGGFHLKFVDNTAATSSTLGKDYSGNNNNWTPNNLSVALGAGNDSVADSPSSSGTDAPSGGVVNGNYCTLNRFDANPTVTFAQGNLQCNNITGTLRGTRGTLPLYQGKWYWEASVRAGRFTGAVIGIAVNNIDLSNNFAISSQGWGYSFDGSKINNGAGFVYGDSWTAGDVIGVAFDVSAGDLYFYKNGVAQNGGVPAFTAITGGPYFPAFALSLAGMDVNFGQQPFVYQTAGVNRPAADYKAVCDTNLPVPSIVKPSTVVDARLYIGNGGTQSITGIEFEPGFVWVKSRSNTLNHVLQDSNRGFFGNTKLSSNSNFAEASFGSLSYISGVSPSSFTVLGAASPQSPVNAFSTTYAAWTWKTASASVVNSSGSVSSNVTADASAGISVVTFTQPAFSSITVGHGLGAAPRMIFHKSRTNTTNWQVYHQSAGAAFAGSLNFPNSFDSGANYWNGTSPTSAVFSLGNIYADGDSVAYCFSEISGYSSFRAYTGNGTSNAFVNCGFAPAIVIIKNISASGDWVIFDFARPGRNITSQSLFPNLSDIERTTLSIDLMSNGFRLRTSDSRVNASSQVYIYAAWARNPFKYARGR